MRSKSIRLLLVLSMMGAALVAASAGAKAAPSAAEQARAEHQRIVDFWTPERVAQAIPRDFDYDPGTGKFVPARGKPAPKPTTIFAKEWPQGQGAVQHTTGKILFQMGRSYYVCSGSLVTDGYGDRSIVLTAGHCVIDNGAKDKPNTAADDRFATNWMFIPDYDSNPVGLDAAGNFCANTTYGCWTATALVVSDGFASAGGFNQQATTYDFAFAVLGRGGLDGNTYAENAVGTQAIAYTPISNGSTVDAFGYPAGSPFDGTKLWYCEEAVGRDASNANLTYALPQCDMTGGSSGGPWFSPFTSTSGSGTIRSLNSYGYTNSAGMYGPVFNGTTSALMTAAGGASGATIVP